MHAWFVYVRLQLSSVVCIKLRQAQLLSCEIWWASIYMVTCRLHVDDTGHGHCVDVHVRYKLWSDQGSALPVPCMRCCAQVYQGVFAMYTRDFKQAASLFHDALATFSA